MPHSCFIVSAFVEVREKEWWKRLYASDWHMCCQNADTGMQVQSGGTETEAFQGSLLSEWYRMDRAAKVTVSSSTQLFLF